MADQVERKETIESQAAIAPAVEENIRDLIYVIRGQQVMLDSDLAALYGVETKNLNRAASRNADRFPVDFRFKLTKDEDESLRFQSGTSNVAEGRGGRRYSPYVYTEQGVAMLSSVLHTEVAVLASVRIMRAFVEMRRFIASNALMFEQIRAVELRQLEYQKSTDERFERIFDCMESREAPAQKIFFEGQVYDAFELLVSLVRKAERVIDLVDGYVDVRTLNILAKKREGVAVTVHTSGKGLTQEDVIAFNAQYPTLTVRRTRAFHDRFLVLDGKTVYHVGASLKDAGRKCFAVSLIQDEEMAGALVGRLRRAGE